MSPRSTVGQCKRNISAVIPVYDEEKTVERVIKTLLSHPLIGEVIAINDGSTDRSGEILKRFGEKIKLINLKKNHGKGFGLSVGTKRANGEIITFWDADLINFAHKHIDSLLKPILSGEAEIVLGYGVRENNKADVALSGLTGERAYYRRDLLPHLTKMARTRFGVEVYLNNALKKKRTAKIPWPDLRALFKTDKFGPQKAFREYFKASLEIARTIGEREIISTPSDAKVLEKISQTSSFKELKKWIKKIKSVQLRKIFEEYILKYIPSTRGRSRVHF